MEYGVGFRNTDKVCRRQAAGRVGCGGLLCCFPDLLFPLGAALCAHQGLAPSNAKSKTRLSVAKSLPSCAARGSSEEHKMQVSC